MIICSSEIKRKDGHLDRRVYTKKLTKVATFLYGFTSQSVYAETVNQKREIKKHTIREDTHNKKCFSSGLTTKGVGRLNPPDN